MSFPGPRVLQRWSRTDFGMPTGSGATQSPKATSGGSYSPAIRRFGTEITRRTDDPSAAKASENWLYSIWVLAAPDCVVSMISCTYHSSSEQHHNSGPQTGRMLACGRPTVDPWPSQGHRALKRWARTDFGRPTGTGAAQCHTSRARTARSTTIWHAIHSTQRRPTPFLSPLRLVVHHLDFGIHGVCYCHPFQRLPRAYVPTGTL